MRYAVPAQRQQSNPQAIVRCQFAVPFGFDHGTKHRVWCLVPVGYVLAWCHLHDSRKQVHLFRGIVL